MWFFNLMEQVMELAERVRCLDSNKLVEIMLLSAVAFVMIRLIGEIFTE